MPLVGLLLLCCSLVFSVLTHANSLVVRGTYTGMLSPLEQPQGLNKKKVALGKQLFFDGGLSSSGFVSCASCHNPQFAGADNKPVSIGVEGRQGTRNAPSVYNSGFNFRQFWDGRAVDLAHQMDGPITNAVEMNSSWSAVIEYVSHSQNYLDAFKNIYGSAPTQALIADALVEFQSSLVTTGSRFDQYLLGDNTALNEEELEGLDLFHQLGCSSCHQGRLLGGNLYEKLGVVIPYYATDRKASLADNENDLGRYNITGDPEHMYEFKVPSLRNVTKTAPYLHDGSVASLSEMIRLMAYHQLGVRLETEQVNKIEAFLATLEAEPSGI